MAANPDARTSLQQLQEELRSGALDPIAVAQAALVRANSNASSNTYLWRDEAWTLRHAQGLAERFSNPPQGPALYGLPISLKDCFDLAGTVTTSGTRFYAERNAPAQQHSVVAQRLINAGAVITGKTHLHPLAYGITGENPDYGDCVQPGHPDRLTGGSSSGAAASVLEGSAVAAIGTDTGGSVRVPAALCGLAGYRCSHPLSRDLWHGGAHLAASFDTIGWLYRDLEDGPRLGHALFGLAPSQQPWQYPRIGIVDADFLADCEPAVLDGYRAAQEDFAAQGATLVQAQVGFWSQAMEIFAPIQASEAARLHAGHYEEFEPAIADRLRWGASLDAAAVHGLRQRHASFCGQMQALLANFDLLALPASPVALLAAGADHTQTRQRLLRYTTPISLAGLPAVTLPARAGIDSGGVQVAAAQGQDATLLAWSARIGRARRHPT